jgi:hypothetical protein
VSRRLARCLLVLCIAFAAGAARAEVQARVAATDPPADATLGRDEPFYVRIQFDADEPVSIWARPYFAGRPVARTKSNASARHAGTGYALGWFSLDAAGEVDEVRVVVGGGKPYRERTVATHPVKLAWTGGSAAARTRAPWVDDLRRETEAAFRQAAQERSNQPAGVADAALMSGFMLLVLALLAGSVAGPAWGLWKWRGGWRLAAAVPAALMAFVVLRIVIDVARDPTSHNLWPFEVLIWGAASVAAIGALALVRRLRGARRAG